MKRVGYIFYVKRLQDGFSYIEIIVATFLIAITLMPALESMEGALAGSEVHQSLSTQHFQLLSKMEEVLAQPYSALETAAAAAASATVPTSFSDAGGTTDRRLVFLFGYDGDNADADADAFTGVDDGLMWVRVEIEGSAQIFESVTSR
ncbi:MAG: hypothetical protein GKR92_01880 [Gammaproteobacteria bacterium]|nr:MAG: hypothetical protein GKR92_01880 [Gammaproteobacteria bacterium]